MWVLECDGDLFEGRKKWLKPGQKYLFGRTTAGGENTYAISNKSVSRKHLVISVSEVPKDQGNLLYEKSAITITDNSKIGTHLDGEHFTNESRTLSGKRHQVKLGSYDQIFSISWRPIVFTFYLTVKEQQRTSDVLAPFRKVLEPFDIKTNITYLALDTTYVVTSKRNVPMSLQALINAKYIVTESFVNAIAAACKSRDLPEDGSAPIPSRLEEDMDGNWPDPLSFLPPPGKEPVPRPIEAYAPDHDRINVFEGFTFIFADDRQFESISPVVMNGGGKALNYGLRLGETNLSDFVEYVRKLAEQRGIPDISNNHTDTKVVVVRFGAKGDYEQWTIDFLQNLDLQLGIRSVEQNEFLDAILTNNASPLHRFLLEEDGPQSTPAINKPTTDTRRNRSHAGEPNVAMEPNQESSNRLNKSASAASKPRTRRGFAESKIKGFDDFDPSQILRKSPEQNETETVSNAGASQPSDQMDTDSNPLFVRGSAPNTRTNKRQHSPTAPNSKTTNEEILENLLPATTAIKRRRLELGQEVGSGSSNSARNTAEGHSTTRTTRIQRKAKEIDIPSAVRARGERLNQQRSSNASFSDNEENDDGMSHEEDITKLRNLALVEDMDLPDRGNLDQYADGCSSRDQAVSTNQWDDRWNGMKNFKKFRRRDQNGQAEAPANRGRRVLVNLVEAKQKDYGIGDNYWLEPSIVSTERRGRTHVDATPHPSGSGVEQSLISATDVGNSGLRGEIGEDEEDEEVLLAEIADLPNDTQVSQGGREATRSRVNEGGAAKRPGPSANASAAKRQRQSSNPSRASARAEESSSDDDELKFRFRRRKA